MKKRVACFLLGVLALWILAGFSWVAAYAGEPPRESLRFQRELTGHARLVWGLSAPVAVFAGQIHQESAWNPSAKSRTGAAGLGQFMPATGVWISGMYRDLGPHMPLNPSWSLRALVLYDRHLWDRVKTADTLCDRMAFTLSDYNGGSGWRMRRQARSPEPGSYAVTGRINPGIHPSNQVENQTYAPKILLRWAPIYRSWGPTIPCGDLL